MCGIIGYTGQNDSVPILIEGLKALEYRGYDSAGISVSKDNSIKTVKSKGRLDRLAEKIKQTGNIFGNCGIGHTRWATHGEPSDVNSHPHCAETLALVHNGIIENYAEIEEVLVGAGYTFESDTDTERAAKLIDMFYKKEHDPLYAIRKACRVIRGSYALGIIFNDIKDTIFATRKDSPLIVSKSDSGCLIASDIPAILGYTREYYRLGEGIIAKIEKSDITFYDENGDTTEATLEKINWNVEQAQKGGFPHFMLKEIHDEPDAVRKTLSPHMKDGLPYFDVPLLDTEKIASFDRIHIVACGTAMHAGIIGKTVIERLARIPVNVEIASEFRYRDPILGKNDLVILISQSGETADTLAALRHCKAEGVFTLAIVNVVGSSVAREADAVLYTGAGPEIAVASTKAYTVQCALLYLMAIRIALAANKISTGEAANLCASMLKTIPESIYDILSKNDVIRNIASRLVSCEHAFFIGRDMDASIATEASLKLKEISYIHSEAYAAGELKHGTISLVTDGTPVVALATVEKICEKTVSGIREVKSRGGYVIVATTPSLAEKYNIPYDSIIPLPEIPEFLLPFPLITSVQMLAYHVSALKGLDVDKPRNLAKSVTVE
ncbi:MAG: glutamine--fructose-6-phosphate transaminase (isomerizing) [Clostridia bacterium]|nr:glutamine--fructose-6-phosphate transaminase (isomerizing) [Clostridia bacterium]